MRSFFVAVVLVFIAVMPLAASPSVRVNASTASTAEGNSGTTSLGFTINQALNNLDITYHYETFDETATAADLDYEPLNANVVIPAGQTSASITVNVLGDVKVEGNETFRLEVGVPGQPPLPSSPITITITNDDAPIATVSNASVTEGNAGSSVLTFNVGLTAPANVPVEMTYATTDVSAIAGNDYQSAAGTLTFAPGETLKPVTVIVNGDTTFETDETLQLSVTVVAPPGQKATGVGTIVNDDARPPTRVAIVSGNGQQGRLGQQLAQPLVVEVLDDVGAPVAGVVVQWSVTKGTAQLSPTTSTTNAQGRASTTVTLDSVGAIEVEARVAQLGAVTFTIASGISLADRATGPVAVPVARVLDQICARNEEPFNGVCRALSNLSDAALTPALERAAPQQSGAQSKVASEVVSDVTAGIGSRLAALRSGTERFSVGQLTLAWNGRAIPFASLAHTLLQTATDAGGSDDADEDYNGWSAFLSGTLGTGERVQRFGQLGFDLKSRGLMFGIDRQVGESSVFGVSVNWMQLESTLNDSAGSLDTTGYALSVYASRSGLLTGTTPAADGRTHYDGVHLDGSVTVGRNRYDAEHVVDIAPLPISVARSENDANLFAISGVTGIEAHRGRTDFDASLSGTWSRASVDDLTETGSGPLILFVQGHEIESTVGSLSLSIRSAFAVPSGTLLPSFRAEMIHEFQSGARLVTAHFLRDRLSTSFTVPLDTPDANYAKLSAGLQAGFAHGYTAYVEVSQDFLRSDLHFRTIQFNVQKSF